MKPKLEWGREALPETINVLEQGITQRIHSGVQLYVSRDGQVVADMAIGEASPGVPLSRDAIMMWLSAGKPITAVALAQLWERGLFDLDEPVRQYIPEFAQNGKDEITIRQVLTHTAGFRWADYMPAMSWEQILERICAAGLEPNWTPGRHAGYHAFTSWYILGEILQRLTGRQFDPLVRDEILTPLGMSDVRFRVTPEDLEMLGTRLVPGHSTNGARPRYFPIDSMGTAATVVPGASARGPANQLGAFYEMLLRHGRTATGQQLIAPQTVEALTARHRAGMFDQTFKQVIDWGLGFIINSSIYGAPIVPYGYGPHASPRTFGHGGSRSTSAFADPEIGLTVVIIYHGMPDEDRHSQRVHAAAAAIYEDLGLVS